MPRYFFDTSDGERRFTDPHGLDLPGAAEARAAALEALGDLARDALPRRASGEEMSVAIRDATGAEWFAVTLRLDVCEAERLPAKVEEG